MAEITAFAPAIAVLPFVSFLVALLAGKYLPKKGALAGILATGGSLALSLVMLYTVATGHAAQSTLYTWVGGEAVPYELTFGILLDQLSTLMLVVVSLISFLVTRFGDYFFLIGVVAVFATFGTAAFGGPGVEESFPHLAELALDGEASVNTFGFAPQTWFTVLGLLVLGGVMGKSAQFPFHTWLPDAMEGPTPVSALIHAATMGVVKREIKQVLAYSTISQYGYIMLALGGGGYVAGVFHLTTHAVFKALLFLGAGSVIIAMHHNENMWDMGGLKEEMPVTYYAFLSGSLALAGIVPFSGFWSKDEVLFETLIHGLGDSPLLLGAYAMGLVAVFFTGFYTFRMVLLTFHGEPRSDTAADPHSVHWNVKAPLVVLGTLAAVVGVINLTPVHTLVPAVPEFLHDWLFHGPDGLNGEHYEGLLEGVAGYHAAYPLGETLTMLASAAVSLGLALAGAGLAVALYRGPEPVEHTDKLGALKTVLFNNYYQDEYQVWLAEGLTARVAGAADTLDVSGIDGVVNFVSSLSLFAGDRLRRLQTGIVSNYAALLTLGLTILLVAFGVMQGWFL